MIVFIQKFYYRNFRLVNLSNLRDVKFRIPICIVSIVFISCSLLYSTAGGSLYPWAIRQFTYFIVSVIAMILTISSHPKLLLGCAYPGYIISLILLAIVRFMGHSSMGAQRWIDFKVFNLQPSEVTKVAIILALAKYFDKISSKFNGSMIGIIPPLAISALPFFLVATQPDLATSLIIVCLSGMMIFASGASINNFFFAGISIICGAPIVWGRLHDYQQKRIINFINPDADPFGSGYNIIQSKIAIGSGGFLGKGFGRGWQSQLNFLPENHTDFIFAVLAEEFGFVGCLVVLSLYGVLIGYGFLVSLHAKSMFLKMTSFGSSCFFFLHVAINAGMTMGVLPAAGVPMPMMSYGGSSMMISMICLGLIINAAIYGRDE